MTTHSGRQPTTVTVVHAPACHLCQDAQHALAEIAADHPLAVELVAAADPRGAALLADHRPALFPLVLVDGAFFSAGRLPRKKLRRLLNARADTRAAGPAVA